MTPSDVFIKFLVLDFRREHPVHLHLVDRLLPQLDVFLLPFADFANADVFDIAMRPVAGAARGDDLFDLPLLRRPLGDQVELGVFVVERQSDAVLARSILLADLVFELVNPVLQLAAFCGYLSRVARTLFVEAVKSLACPFDLRLQSFLFLL